MTAIHIQLPDSLAEEVREFAEHHGVSLDQFLSTAVVKNISGWMAEDLFQRRAARGSRANFEKALAQVPSLPPEEHDRL